MKQNLLLIVIAALVGLLVGATVTGATSMLQNPQPDSTMLNLTTNDMMDDMQKGESGMMGSGMMGGMMQGMGDMMNANGQENMMTDHMAHCREMMDSVIH